MAQVTLKGNPVQTIDENSRIIYSQLVPEIGEEPDDEEALKVR